MTEAACTVLPLRLSRLAPKTWWILSRRQGLPCDRIVVAGGIRSNSLWLEVIVDTIGKPVCLTRETNLSILAGAVAGAFALGHYDSLEDASTEL